MTRCARILLAIALSALAAGAAVAGTDGAPELSLPIACEPGKTCFIQSYVDVDPGPEARDFTCGSATYEGHKGTDFRVLSAAAAENRVSVLASAPGVVKGVRDGMSEGLLGGAPRELVAKRECGNGVVVDHGNGWETQYCHMRPGSLAVKQGDKVERGAKLGEVGATGLAEFAHVHLEVRRDGKPIEPFTGTEQSGACALGQGGGKGLWAADAVKAFPYRNTVVIGSGFTGDPSTLMKLEIDHRVPPPAEGSPAIYYWVRIANIRKGDFVRLALTGPKGFKLERDNKPLERNRAVHLEWMSAKTASGGPMPAGVYRGKAELVRDGKVVETREGEHVIGKAP